MTKGLNDKEQNGRDMYADIIDLPHWQSPIRPHMSLYDRAAQFSSYKALSGYEDMVAEEARLTEDKISLEDFELEMLNQKLQLIADSHHPTVTFTVFVPDQTKAGGSYVEITDSVKRVDMAAQKIVLMSARESGMNNTIDFDSPAFCRHYSSAITVNGQPTASFFFDKSVLYFKLYSLAIRLCLEVFFVQVGAVIVAAGRSSRMGDFKPMLNIGSISIAQRVVATFHQAGVSKLVMVTGYNALQLERHLAGSGLVFLRNEDYASTQMFDSAKIGLSYLRDKCDRILFTPVDVPLFTALTVTRLIESGAELACPVCEGSTGHPLLISSALVDTLLQDSGEGGLQGAISRCGVEMARIEVDDPGILHDADTPEDYRALLRFHNEQLVRPVLQVSLAREKVFFDGRAAMLLRLIDETQSVRTACQRMQMSYSSGWNVIRTLESQLGRSLILRSQGGAGGGKSSLTADGRLLLARFDAYSDALREKAGELFDAYFERLF